MDKTESLYKDLKKAIMRNFYARNCPAMLGLPNDLLKFYFKAYKDERAKTGKTDEDLEMLCKLYDEEQLNLKKLEEQK